jgi:hypothetical protein
MHPPVQRITKNGAAQAKAKQRADKEANLVVSLNTRGNEIEHDYFLAVIAAWNKIKLSPMEPSFIGSWPHGPAPTTLSQ